MEQCCRLFLDIRNIYLEGQLPLEAAFQSSLLFHELHSATLHSAEKAVFIWEIVKHITVNQRDVFATSKLFL